jgi:hypothetical protein
MSTAAKPVRPPVGERPREPRTGIIDDLQRDERTIATRSDRGETVGAWGIMVPKTRHVGQRLLALRG